MTDISDRIEEQVFDSKNSSIDEDPITSSMNPISYLIVGESILNFIKKPLKPLNVCYQTIKGAIKIYRENGDFPEGYFKGDSRK